MEIDRYEPCGYADPTANDAISNLMREQKKAMRVKARAYKPLVFICSPFAGDAAANTGKARIYLRFAIDKGYIPFAPHLLYPQVLDEAKQAERELGLFMGLAFLGKCDELWVFGAAITEGMSREIQRAKRKDKKIRYFTEDLMEVYKL
jgi:hypothetical protein